MSQKLNRLFDSWKVVELQVRRDLPRMTFLGETLESLGQVTVVSDALILNWILWDGSLVEYSGKNACDFDRWWRAIVEVGEVSRVLDAFKAASDLLVACCEQSLELTYDDFKHRLKVSEPMVGAILGPIKVLIAAALGKDLNAFRIAFSALRFLRKLNINSKKLEEKAREAYLENERQVAEPQTILERIILAHYFPVSLTATLYERISPHHGDGSTADAGTDIMDKYHSLGSDALLHYFLKDTPIDEWSGHFARESEIQFVPKTYSGYRTIGKEPATLMWYQEGLNEAINSLIREVGLARRYNPKDQSRNRELARLGSINKTKYSMCTIDLHAASDLVGYGHVKSWFSNTCLLRALIAFRTPCSRIKGYGSFRIRKFANMGAADCFPVESLVFIAITTAAILDEGGDPSKSNFVVYGDDIIVEAKYFDAVCKRLELNGFVVNPEKSFCGRGDLQFRESCGAFWLNGLDVTPLQISRKFAGFSGVKSSWVPAAIDLANACFSHAEARYLRLYVIQRLMTLPRAIRPPFSEVGGPWLWSENPTNFHLDKWWNYELQEIELSCGMTSVAYGEYDEGADGPFMLYEWLRLAEQARNGEGRKCHSLVPDPGSVISKPKPILSHGNKTPKRKKVSLSKPTSRERYGRKMYAGVKSGIRWVNKYLPWFCGEE